MKTQPNIPIVSGGKAGNIILLLIALSFLVIGISLFYSRSLDEKIFIAINAALPNSTLWLTISNIGDGLFVGCILFVIFRNRIEVLCRALYGGLAVHFTVQILKKVIASPRPSNTEHIKSVANIFGEPMALTNFSMPSGHSAAIFMALGLVYLNRQLFVEIIARNFILVMIFLTSILVVISRIAVAAHWPSDVFAGSALGLIIAAIVNQIPVRLTAKSTVIIYLLYIPFVVFPIVVLAKAKDFDSYVSDGFMAVAALVAGYFLFKKLKVASNKVLPANQIKRV